MSCRIKHTPSSRYGRSHHTWWVPTPLECVVQTRSYLPLTHLGKLELIEVYEFYDQPILFSCRNASDAIFMGVFADEGDFETWLYIGVSLHRLIRSGAIDLHSDGVIFQCLMMSNASKCLSLQLKFRSMLPFEFTTLPELDEDLRRKSSRNYQPLYRTEFANALRGSLIRSMLIGSNFVVRFRICRCRLRQVHLNSCFYSINESKCGCDWLVLLKVGSNADEI